jgi:ATP-dependent phosphofructokinase / diphosphate-dependent phosphofructokinase
MEKRIGLLTAGGDAPGLNVCLKAIVFNAIDHGYEVVGIRKGWEGLLRFDPRNSSTHADNAMVLTKARVRDIDRMSGSYLHSSRVDPSHVAPQAAPAFLRPAKGNGEPLDLTSHVMRAVDVLGLTALILVGDNFSLNYAARLNAAGVPVIGIPKSVHNDVNGSDYCLGFSTALAHGVRLVHDLRAMAGSREEVVVAEMFGRSAGLTTLLIGHLASCDRTLIPEVPFDPERLAALLAEDKRNNPNNYAVLALSEAVSIDPERAAQYGADIPRRASARRPAAISGVVPPIPGGTHAPLAAHGHGALDASGAGYTLGGDRLIGLGAAGGGTVVTEILENLMHERLLYQPLTYLLRAGQPDGQDLLGAMNFATLAVNLLAAGQTGRLAAYRRGENYVDLPLDVVTTAVGNVDVAQFYDAAYYRAKPGVLWATRV